MSGGEDVKIDPVSVLQAGQGVSTALAQAAEPGPVPYATGASPIDAAAAAASSQVIGLVSAASADSGTSGRGSDRCDGERGVGTANRRSREHRQSCGGG